MYERSMSHKNIDFLLCRSIRVSFLLKFVLWDTPTSFGILRFLDVLATVLRRRFHLKVLHVFSTIRRRASLFLLSKKLEFFLYALVGLSKIMRSTAGRKRQLKRKRRGGYARAYQIHASPVRFMDFKFVIWILWFVIWNLSFEIWALFLVTVLRRRFHSKVWDVFNTIRRNCFVCKCF